MTSFVLEGPGGIPGLKQIPAGGSVTTKSNWIFTGSVTFQGVLNFDSSVITATDVNAFVVGQNGATNPAFKVDTSVASSTTGLSLTSEAAGGGVIVSVISSGTNESFFVRPKGNGGFRIQGASSVCLQVGPVSGGGPSFVVNNNAGTSATGVQIVTAAAAGGVAVSAISTGTDESMTISAKGAGTLTFQSAVVAAAGGAAASGIRFGSINVGLFTGTGAPTFSAMNGSIYVDSNATTTTTRMYVNKSGAGTAGTTWTNLTTAA